MCGHVPGIHAPGIHVPGLRAFGAEPSRGWPGTEGPLRPSSRAMPGHDAAAMTLQRCFHMIGTGLLIRQHSGARMATLLTAAQFALRSTARSEVRTRGA